MEDHYGLVVHILSKGKVSLPTFLEILALLGIVDTANGV